jgi:hypothetical protein
MRAAFAATEEGLAAFLSGLVDQLLSGHTLQPQDGDTPELARIKTLGRAYRDAAAKMLHRLSGMDEIGEIGGQRPIQWPSQNALSYALLSAYKDGIDVAQYVAPPRELTAEEDQALTDAIADLIENDPAVRAVVEEFNRLHPDNPIGPQ